MLNYVGLEDSFCLPYIYMATTHDFFSSWSWSLTVVSCPQRVGANWKTSDVVSSAYPSHIFAYSPFALAWNGYEPVHGIVLKNGSASVYTSYHNMCVYHRDMQPCPQLMVVAVAISQFYKCMSQVQGTNCAGVKPLEQFCLY